MNTDLTNTDWAYLAGLLDGEGYFEQHQAGRTVRLSINMTDEATVRQCAAMFGGKVNFKPSTKPRCRDQWTWRLSKQADLKRVLEGIRPYLRLKAPQCDLMLQFLAVAKGAKPDDEQRIAAFEAMQGMNVRGVKEN